MKWKAHVLRLLKHFCIWNSQQFYFQSTVYAPLLRLSPPPGEHDYYFNLDDSEGVCDLFDIPNLDMPSPLTGAMAST